MAVQYIRESFSRNLCDDVPRQDAPLSELLAGGFTGFAVEIDGCAGGVEIGHSLADEGGEDAGEDGAGAGFGEGGVASGVDVEFASIGNDGAVAFQDDGLAEGFCG